MSDHEFTKDEIEAAARALRNGDDAYPDVYGDEDYRNMALAALRAAADVRDNGDLTIHLMKRHEVEAEVERLRSEKQAISERAASDVLALEAEVEAAARLLAQWGIRSRHGGWTDQETQRSVAKDALRAAADVRAEQDRSHVCVPACRPNAHIAFKGRADFDAALARAEAAEAEVERLRDENDDLKTTLSASTARQRVLVSENTALRAALDMTNTQSTDSKCWRHDYNHREYVCTCNPPVEGDTGREPTDSEASR